MIIHLCQTGLVFTQELGLKRPVAIARRFDLNVTVLTL